MRAIFQVRMRRPVGFIRAALNFFRADCFLSLEGDLSRYDPSLVPTTSPQPNALLPRNTTSPEQQFLILPVTPETLEPISRRILPQIGLRRHVLHVQVASAGRLVLGAYDSFHRECVWIDQAIGQDGIASLLNSRIIGWYEAREWT